MTARAWIGLGATAGVAVAVATVIACSSSSVPPPPPPAAGGLCATSPGTYPVANCTDYAPDAASCNSPALKCSTTPCNQSSPCLAMNADNTGQSVASLRLRKLNVTAPPTLATTFVQKAVIDQGINLENFCGEGGDGTFSWLMQFDTVHKTFTTGGAPPTSDPFGQGYCFVNTTINGTAVAPIQQPLTQAADGTYESGVIPKLNVPIYIGASVMGTGAPSVVVLPITNGKVQEITLSESNNCIGNYNADAVTPVDGGVCVDDPTSCARWTTAGSLGGYITLDDADSVDVPQLSESLCVLLTSGSSVDSSNPNEKTCIKSGGNVVAKGNFCSTTQAAGGCADSYWLAATFAASAAKIVAANQPACMGVVMGGGDGGTGDAGGGDGAAASDAPNGG